LQVLAPVTLLTPLGDQTNVLATLVELATSTFVVNPLQTAAGVNDVITGVGCTVWVIPTEDPTQPPTVEVGMTLYVTLPSPVLIVFVSRSAIGTIQPELHVLAPVTSLTPLGDHV
jgi:hypothetical protein